MRDESRKLPFHHACLMSDSVALIEYMSQMSQGGVMAKSDEGSALHHALLNETDQAAQIVTAVLEAHPKTCCPQLGQKSTLHHNHSYRIFKTCGPVQILPLHLACARADELDSSALLLKIANLYPDALKAPTDTTKRLPLHLLCATAKSVDSVAGLIKLFPEALAVKDADGQLPLHVACSNTSVAATEIVQTVMEAAPEALQCADSAGNLPLHICSEYGTSSTLISQMVALQPAAVTTANEAGNMPLHCAIRNTSRGAVSIAKVVIQLAPEILQQQNTGGNTPIHHLVHSVHCNGGPPGIDAARNFGKLLIASQMLIIDSEGTCLKVQNKTGDTV